MKSPPLERTGLDRRIWEEELDEFVPAKVFDVHTHLYRWAFHLDPNKRNSGYAMFLEGTFEEATWEFAERVERMLMPGREVHRLSFPFPFPHPCDFDGSHEFLAEQIRGDRQSAGLMLVDSQTTVEQAEATLDRYAFVGFKPYRFYASTGDAVNCRIPEFMPERLVELAHRRGLIIMMHVSKRDAIADPENLDDLRRLCDRWPNAKWILAHCARSYSAWAIEKAAPVLRSLPNVWFDTSSVCESDSFDALFSEVGASRVMYGSDDVPIGVLRGKYIAFGRAWGFLSESNHALGLSHCDARMTFTRYEQLRAMKRAAKRAGLTRDDLERLFWTTAANLVESARRSST